MLAGITVLDLADETGSCCSRLLADLGARVIKIERTGGDSSRNIGPFRENPAHAGRESLSFAYHNAGKLGVTLDLERPTGRTIFLKLVRKSDVLVETAPPGYFDRLGIGYSTVKRDNPRIVWASITGFGQSGPRRDFKSCDIVAAALGGQMFACGSPSAPPLKLFGEQSFFTASLHAAVGILLALRRARATGQGDHVDISVQESVVSTLGHAMMRYFHQGVVTRRRGSRHWNDMFCILACRDGFIQLAPFLHWDALVALLDRDGMAADLSGDAWNEEGYRLEHAEHAIAVIGQWTATRSAGELFALGQLLRLPWAPVASPLEVLNSPQLQAREFFGRCGLPYRFSSVRPPAPAAAPRPGQDNEAVYARELGLSRQHLARLSATGVV